MSDEDAQRELAAQMVEQARAAGIDLVGPGRLPTGLTKQVLEALWRRSSPSTWAPGAHDPAGRNKENSRNGTRTRTVLTDVGPVEIEVPRDRDGAVDPVVVKKRQRRLEGLTRSCCR